MQKKKESKNKDMMHRVPGKGGMYQEVQDLMINQAVISFWSSRSIGFFCNFIHTEAFVFLQESICLGCGWSNTRGASKSHLPFQFVSSLAHPLS